MTFVRTIGTTLFAGMVTFAVGCGPTTEEGTGTETGTPSASGWTSVSGRDTMVIYEDVGSNPDGSDATVLYECTGVYDVTGAPYSEACDGCEYAFDADWTYNAGASDFSGCAGVLDEATTWPSYSQAFGFLPGDTGGSDFNGFAYYEYGGEWLFFGLANSTVDATTGGTLTWDGRYYASDEVSGSYYYYYLQSNGSVTME